MSNSRNKNHFAFFVFSLVLNSYSAFASTSSSINLKTNQGVIDPYYQIQKRTITELSDEEALEFELDMMFTNGEKAAPKLPKIPPRPPEAGNGEEDLSEENIQTNNNDTNSSKTDPAKKDIPKKDPPRKETSGNTDSNKGSTSDLVASNGSGLTAATGGGIAGALDQVILVVDKVMAIGQKITPIIEKGRPIVTNNPMAALSVIPRMDTKDPVLHEMGGWSIPMTKHYKIAFSNGFGSEVVSFVYSITYQYGGSFNGSGKYLTGVRASARNIVVNWGFDLDASSSLIQISNIGTQANVVAGATVEISYTIKNWSRVNTTNEAFFISGDGRLFKLD